MLDHGLHVMKAVVRGRDAQGETPRPPCDASSAVVFAAVAQPPVRPQDIVSRRTRCVATAADVLAAADGIEHREVIFESHDGASLPLAVFRRRGNDAVGPGFVYIHGGGMIGGNRFDGIGPWLDHLAEHGGAVVSVEYRLAPEHPAPIPVEDCYAALTWVVGHAETLGIDPSRLVVGGFSAGGGLAAGVMLLARDRGGPPLLGVQLECPMLDDRNDSTSIRQFFECGGWCGRSNEVGWTALLGSWRGTAEVSPYDAPARAPWLGGLPPVYISVGSADPFRDEDVAFASALWRDGGDCELHVVPGGPHGHELLIPEASIARATRLTRKMFVARLLHPDAPSIAAEALARAMTTTPERT